MCPRPPRLEILVFKTMCERGVRKSRKGQTEACVLAQNSEVSMDLAKLLNDPTQEVIHRRLSSILA